MSEILYIPNIITAFRLVLTPFILYHMYFENWQIAFFVGFVAVVSDFLDGTIARRLNMVSDFGRKFDPTVDKIVLLSIFFVIYQKKLAPDWFSLMVIVKDVSIPVVLLIGKMRGVKLNFSPTKMGKAAVALQFLYVILLVSEKALDIKTYYAYLMFPMVVFCFLSLASYVVLIYKLVSRAKVEDKIDI
ncbi:MAG: CDP-alcohol phosphatidyltransferase family protein [Candidatus Calescibacterium sp.]|nr:CDP-alcohol phosphatidyltransferase family protein [Candidatus Calescibacterium sp.]MCX7734676.1 CDP-alcohol phosphatidyltransferase family protein [bacterium]MDW8087801.1 CDP-alcohol phosphatidyltransferase family protein [Candidatus Calescibacterium sp.]